MTEQIYWVCGFGMKKFHAFTVDDGHSLCRKWFMGGRAYADEWDKKYGKESKCQVCKSNSVKESLTT